MDKEVKAVGYSPPLSKRVQNVITVQSKLNENYRPDVFACLRYLTVRDYDRIKPS